MDLTSLSQIIKDKTEPTASQLNTLNQAINQFVAQGTQPNISTGNDPQDQMRQIQADIRSARMTQGITQRTLASRAGTSQGTITRAECHGWVSIYTLMKIAKGLNKTIKLT
jgi:DNA-binding XRE family transcriptional regulator